MVRLSDSDRAAQLKTFVEAYRQDHGGRSPSDYAITKQFGWGAGVITRVRRLLAESGMTAVADSPEPDREDRQKSEIFNQLEQVLRPVVDTLYEHTLGREQRVREELNERLRQRGQTLERVSGELASVQTELDGLRDQLAERDRQLSEQAGETKDLKSEVAQRDRALEQLQQRLNDMTATRDTLQKTETRLLDQIERLHQAHVDQRETDRQHAVTEKEALQKTLVETQQDLRNAREEIATLSQAVKDEHQRYVAEQGDRKRALDEARQFRERAESLQAQVTALTAENDAMQNEATSATHEKQMLEARIASLEEKVSDQSEALADKSSLNEQLRQSLSECKARSDTLASQLQSKS